MFDVDLDGERDEAVEIRGRYNREPHPYLRGYVHQYLALERNAARHLGVGHNTVMNDHTDS